MTNPFGHVWTNRGYIGHRWTNCGHLWTAHDPPVRARPWVQSIPAAVLPGAVSLCENLKSANQRAFMHVFKKAKKGRGEKHASALASCL
jgi:hypothetical protein